VTGVPSARYGGGVAATSPCWEADFPNSFTPVSACAPVPFSSHEWCSEVEPHGVWPA